MKRSVPGLALLCVLSSVVWADDRAADAKPTLESECRAIGESHGVAPEKMDDWMKRCLERTQETRRRMDDKNKGHGTSHDGMNGAGHDAMGDMHGKAGREAK